MYKRQVKLFSSILKIEDGKYYLVTPVEKVGIIVDDAPMLAIDFDAEGQGEAQVLRFHTKTEDESVAGPDNPIPVSYTHLDVYKRQAQDSAVWKLGASGLAASCTTATGRPARPAVSSKACALSIRRGQSLSLIHI